MGKTQFVTLTTREFVLLARLEGQVRTMLKMAETYNDPTRPARISMSETLTLLANHRRNGHVRAR